MGKEWRRADHRTTPRQSYESSPSYFDSINVVLEEASGKDRNFLILKSRYRTFCIGMRLRRRRRRRSKMTKNNHRCND